jgi:uncharacterized protein YkwD
LQGDHLREACVVKPLVLRSVAAGAVVLSALATGRIGIAASQHSPTSSKRGSAKDRWRAYLADEATCPGGPTSAPLASQARTLNCLINYARAERGLRRLRISPVLSVAARRKAEAIQRCHVFDHAPCGGQPSDVAVRAGYTGRFAEALYLGERHYGSPRWAVNEWLHSAPHRAQLLSPSWRAYSGYAARVAELDGMHDATLWVAQFGDR